MPTRCFWLEPIDRERVFLRRYAKETGTCPLRGTHSAKVHVWDSAGNSTSLHVAPEHAEHMERQCNALWPIACECGYEFSALDHYQLLTAPLFTRSDTGERTTLSSAPPGAMWDAVWLPDPYHGPDGRAIVVKLPNGGEWLIDARANNCTMPHDTAHQCWVRHGEPPNLTVNKDGYTCAAGGGSIWSRQGSPDEWHGFLTNGILHLAGEAPHV